MSKDPVAERWVLACHLEIVTGRKNHAPDAELIAQLEISWRPCCPSKTFENGSLESSTTGGTAEAGIEEDHDRACLKPPEEVNEIVLHAKACGKTAIVLGIVENKISAHAINPGGCFWGAVSSKEE
jgi:hypothetical protein